MKKYLLPLIVAASAVIHAPAADLARQLEGYWKPDMEKTLALAKKAERGMDPMAQALMGRMVFEFQNGKMTIHPPAGGEFVGGPPPTEYKVIAEDKTAKALTLKIDDKETKIIFDKEQMAMHNEENGWMVFNRMSKENFEKRKPVGAEILEEGDKEAPAAEKLEDISAQPIPDKPAAGKVRGKEFKIEMAKLEDGSLVLRQGEGFATHLEEFEITFRGENVGNYAGKTFTVKPDQKNTGFGIQLAYSTKPGSISTSTLNGGYAMRLEFGTAKNGKIPGKIHLRLKDEAGSFVVGTFEADIK